MSDNEIFLIVKKYIDLMDCYALLAGGAPNDEFDSESKEISKKIHSDQSVQELADIISQVFNASFNEHDAPTMFLSVAEQIKKELVL